MLLMKANLSQMHNRFLRKIIAEAVLVVARLWQG